MEYDCLELRTRGEPPAYVFAVDLKGKRELSIGTYDPTRNKVALSALVNDSNAEDFMRLLNTLEVVKAKLTTDIAFAKDHVKMHNISQSEVDMIMQHYAAMRKE